jgi:hypothetical protein
MHPIKPTVPRCDVEKLVVGSELEKNTGADCVYKLRGSGIDVNATYRAKPPFLWEKEIAVPGGVPGSSVEGASSLDGWVNNLGFVG